MSAPSIDFGARAYASRLALYRAAGLDVADKVRPPDERFADAVTQLGREHPAVGAAVATRNALALTAEPIVVAVAAAYARSLPELQRREAEQEAWLAAMRAAELWTPGGGASFTNYARRWIRKYVSRLADRARAVTRPERARLAGETIELEEYEPRIHRDLAGCEVERIEEFVELESRVAQLDRAVAELSALEREVIACELGRVGSRTAAAASLGLRARDYSRTLERALEHLRRTLVGAAPGQTELLAR